MRQKSSAVFLLFAFCQTQAQASDWGYDGSETPPQPQIQEQSAAGLAKSILKTKPDKVDRSQGTSKNAPPRNTSAGSSKSILQDNTKKAASGTVRTKAPLDKGAKLGANLNPSALQAIPKSPVGPLSESRDPIEMLADKDQQAARCWLQLFQVCSKNSMDYPQQKRLEAYMLGKARQGEKQNDEVRSILKFWPKLLEDLRGKPEMEMHYADLFRALLRLRERTASEKTNVEASPFSSDADLISELLGLERIAVPGNPAFTEDAVNAYSDMAFFIYEQQNAGRTIDASDNRSLFAKVVVEKFNRAPTEADQRAMASFDLAWAKFKVIWYSSDEQTQKLLLEKLVKSGAGSTFSVRKDPQLDLVLSNWPWKTSP